VEHVADGAEGEGRLEGVVAAQARGGAVGAQGEEGRLHLCRHHGFNMRERTEGKVGVERRACLWAGSAVKQRQSA
jgi:hypothetical protein